MADSAAIRAGRAFVELFVDDSKAQKALRRWSQQWKQTGTAIMAAGARIAAAGAGVLTSMSALTLGLANTASAAVDMADRLGISAEAAQELGFAAEQAGSSSADLEAGIRKMTKTIGEAASGSKSAQATLDELGLSLGQLQGLSPDQQFALIADRLSKIPDPAVRAAKAMEIFGKGGAKLGPLLAGGAAGLDEMRAKARSLGLVIDEDTARSAEEFGDVVSQLRQQLGALLNQIGAALLPALKQLAAVTTEYLGAAIQWIKENRGLIVSIAMGAAGVVALGVAIVGLGSVVWGIGMRIGLLATALSAVGSLLTFLASPIGIAVAALGGLVTWFVTSTEAGRQMVATLSANFSVLQEDATTAFGEIAAALGRGDITNAAKVLWAYLNLLWTQGTQNLLMIWEDWKGYFLQLGSDAFYGVVETVNQAGGMLEKAWVDVTSGLSTIWANVWAGIESVGVSAFQFLYGLILRIRSFFDETLDLAAELKQLEEFGKGRQGEIAAQRDAKLAAVGERAAARRAEIDKATTGASDVIQGNAQRSRDGIAANRQQRIADAQAKLDAARAEMDAAIVKSRVEGKRAGQAGSTTPSGPEMPKPPDTPKAVTGAAVQGTFNAAVIGGIGVTTVAERTAKASEDTAKQTKRAADILDDANLDEPEFEA